MQAAQIATSFTHTDLQYKTEHSYYIRSVNKDGHSAWSKEFVTESADDPFRLSPDVTEDQITWEGAIYGSHNPILAFDETFQSGDAGFHSDGNSIGQKLTVDYGNAYVLDYVEYYPRDDAGNGTVTKMMVETSLDGVNWIQHGDQTDGDGNKYFQMERSADMKTLDLSDPNTGAGSIGARYIRFTPLESVGNFFSASEIKVFTIDGGFGSAQSPFRVGNISSVGMSEPTLTTFQLMFQKESSAHGSDKNPTWVGEVQNQYGDINFNGIADIWDYAFTAFNVDGGTTQTGSVSGDILLQPSATTVASGDKFTISVTALDVANLNAYGSIINYDPDKVEYVGVDYVGTSAMYTQGMTGNAVYDDGTAYVNHNAINMGDQPLVNGSKVLATITMRAKADIDLSDTDVIDLSTATLMGPDFSVKESKVVNEVEIPEIPTKTTVEYGQDAFNITMTNDVLTSDDGSNVGTIVQTGNYNGLFDGAYGRDFEFVWDMGDNVLPKGQILPTTIHLEMRTPSRMSTIEVYNASGSTEKSNGYLTSMSAEVTYADGSTSTTKKFETSADVYTVTVDPSRNVSRIDLTFLTSTGTANTNNNPRENRMLTLGEIDFKYTDSQSAEAIAPVEGTAREMFVGYVESINAVVYPEGFPNQYFTVESSNPEVASIITMVDANGAPSYKVLGLKAGKTDIKLTSAADPEVTHTYTLTVTEGVDKSELVDAISATTGVTESIYTADSYKAYKTAFENAVTVNDKADATRAQVEAAVEQLLAAYDALVIQSVDESLILKESIVKVGDALYSESNTYDKMFDNDLSTYWESPYGGENAKLPQDVVLELADTYQLEQVSFTSHTIQNGGVTEYTVSVSTDGEKWTEVASGTVDANAYKQGQNVRVDARFAPADAKYVKFTVEGAVGRIAEEDNMYGRIAEMDLYGTTKADKTKLNNLIATVKGLDQSKYTEESWAALSEPLAAAEAVAADSSATTAQVKDAYDALAAAKEALVETTEPGPTPEDPREELAVLVGQMSGVQNDNYTTESWDAFQAQIEDAIDLLQDASATDEAVQAMIDALNAAYAGLVKDGKAELGSVIDQMEKVEKGNYTDTSWNAFQAKLDEAKAMLDAGTATDEEMLAMAQALQAAFDSLVKKDDGQPGKPGTGTGGSSTDGDKAVQTGDAAVPAGLLAVLAISGGAVVVLARRKKVR